LSENLTNNGKSIENLINAPILNDPTAGYKKNLTRLLILSGMGVISMILLAICFYLISIKIF